ncbi:ArsR family transcriptional regulator [Spirillospora sp. NPDC048819]|uniref:arsenate reductase/protein-tyrosine-phosphatase family protein n=1 Tax=Spirillospora sp. NPDC048819 TaxID=3155268 RepID=UPI0033C8215E
MESTGQAVPAFVRLAAHPLRWRLLTELAGSDLRVRELVELLGQPQNLVSYHLRLLREGGLVTAHRSSFDSRDSYYHLDLERCAHALAATGAGLHPALHFAPTPLGPVATGTGLDPAPHFAPAPPRPVATGAGLPPAPHLDPTPPPPASAGRPARPRVLFTCTGNSARSPIAEALLRHRTGGHAEVTSAGSHPRAHLHPDAVRILHEDYGIDVGDQRPRHLDTLARRPFDYVISLCDKVREVCPEFDGRPRRLHWSIPDPAAASRPDRAAFRHTAAQIDTRIRYLLPVLATDPEVSHDDTG